MPRYFFHLSFGQRVVPDEEGVELPSRAAARNEALAVVRDLANPEIGGNARRWARWFLDVSDEQGRFFRTPIGYPALQVVTPDPTECRAEPREPRPMEQAATAFIGDVVVARARTAEIVRQMSTRQSRTAQLLKANDQLRRELLSLCRACEAIGISTRRLVALARVAGGRY